MQDAFEKLRRDIARVGVRLSALPIRRLAAVRTDFDELGIDTGPYFNFNPPRSLGFTVRSVLVTAVSSPRVMVRLKFEGGNREVLIPPAYADQDAREAEVEAMLAKAAAPHRIARALRLPRKAIAARSGLGEYGRNQMIYVEGMGSFCNLYLFFSDISVDDVWAERTWMNACASCDRRCARACPTGALGAGATLGAQRCLTTQNEHGRGDFPEWIDPAWHHALIGCMRCQEACPRNAANLKEEPRVLATLSRANTAALLAGDPEVAAHIGLREYAGILGRNLRACLKDLPAESKQEISGSA